MAENVQSRDGRFRRAVEGIPGLSSVDAPLRMRWALVLVVVWHGGLLLNGSYEQTYDAWVHVFLGDHYARDWFSTWEPRWYTGFTTVSYPPGSHMAIAAVSKVVGGLDTAFVIVQVFALLNLTVGVYRFSRIWVDREAAANASLLLVASSAISETVHLYGQLPTIFSLGFLLHAAPFVRRWAFGGRKADLIAGVTCLAATTAGHHVTTLFGSIFFLGPILVWGLIEQSRIPRDDEAGRGDSGVTFALLVPLAARRLRRIAAPVVRIAILGPLILGVLVVVILPYWFWSATDPIVQLPIPHGSRANFLQDLNMGLVFWLIPWGFMLLALPYGLLRATLDRKWPLAASIGLLTVLGTGGTTPISRLLLGPAYDILTLDRFTFWASILILPLAGQMVSSIEHGSIATWIRQTLGRRILSLLQVALVVGLVAFSLFAGSLARFREFQPDPIDPGPIVAFLEKDQHERWRFLTLGFGDQMAWLSTWTTATQVDGNYHSVRRLPELTSTGVERLEGAKYRGIAGLGSLQQFLEVPEKYHLKFVFSNDRFYAPLLYFSGWQRLGPLENGIIVWERADIAPLPAQLPIREVPGYQRILWAVVPPTMLILGILQIVWSALGRPGLSRHFDRAAADRRVVFGPFRALDRLLGLLSARIPPGSRSRCQPRQLGRLQDYLRRPISRRRRRLRVGLILAVTSLLPAWVVFEQSEVSDPATTVEAYYDHLDFRRWPAAYSLLDPETRPDYELWKIQTLGHGGLLASYGKLDRITVETVSIDKQSSGPSRAVVDTSLRYLTALDWYPTFRRVEMVQRLGGWYVVPDEPSIRVSPDQLVRRAGVAYLIQGRRQASGITELADVQDRPELWISGAKLVLEEGRPVIVGQVSNLDVDPADLTITGLLKDDNDKIVLRYNASLQVAHRLLPRESTAFRIGFEEVAAGADLDFDPLDFNPVAFDPQTMVRVEVYANAVVASDGLYRGLSINEVAVVEDGNAVRLEGELRNDGTKESTVPMLLVSFLDEHGDVGWVENYFLETAIRSQRSSKFSFELPVTTLQRLELSPLGVNLYHNGVVSGEEPLPTPTPLITDLPAQIPFDSLRIEVVSFTGGQS